MAKTAIILTSLHQEWAHSWTGAFATGLERHGWEVRTTLAFKPCDMLVQWGTRRREFIDKQKKAGGEVCILERGYLLDRMADWASVSFGGGLNNRGEFRGPFSDPSRWEKHFAHLMQPWKGIRGGYALILGQVPGDMSVQNVKLTDFYAKAYAAFRDQGFDVLLRKHPHPNAQRAPVGNVPLCGAPDLEAALSGASCAVTWNSNSAVDSVLAGVPTVTMDEGAMAWDVTGHELKYPPSPDREAWANRLAYCQWTKEEMASGECWAAVGEASSCEQAA